MWAHEYWWLQDRDGGVPDIVTFGGKAGVSGFFSTYDYRAHPQCQGLEQIVDMTQLINFGLTWKEVQSSELLELVHDTSSFLKIELGNIQRDTGLIENIRGNGTLIGFDLVDVETESVLRWLQKRGLLVSRTGPKTLCLRPALILGPSQAKHLREALKYYDPKHDKATF